jgi:hypothetical protein
MDNAGAMPNVAQEARNKPFSFIILDRLEVVIAGHWEAAWLGSTGSGGFQPPVHISARIPEWTQDAAATLEERPFRATFVTPPRMGLQARWRHWG